MKSIFLLVAVFAVFFVSKAQTGEILADSALRLYNAGLVSDSRSLVCNVLYKADTDAIHADSLVWAMVRKAKNQTTGGAENSDSLEKSYNNYISVLNFIAGLYTDSGQYEKALPLYLEANENAGRFLKTQAAYRNSLNNLGRAYYETGEYEKALPLYLEALDNTEKTFGKEHSEYGISQRNLARVYQETGQNEKAVFLLLEAKQNIEKTLGKEHPEYFETCNNLSFAYKSTGKYDKALPLMFEVLENYEKQSGKGEEYHVTLCTIGLLYAEAGQYSSALPLMLENVEYSKKTFGSRHFLYQIYLGHLIDIYQAMNQYDKAFPLILEVLEIIKQIKGKEHFEYGLALRQLGSFYTNQGEYEKALPVYLEVLENTEKSLGKEHNYYNDALSRLANLYKHLGQYEKALPLSLEVLENTEKSLGKEHPYYGSDLDNLGGLYQEMGQYEKALDLSMQALEHAEKTLGKTHLTYGLRLNNVASLYRVTGQYKLANNYYNQGIDIAQNFLADNLFGIDEDLKTSLIDDISYISDIQQSLFVAYPDSFINEIGRGWENVSFFKGLALKSGNLLMQQLRASSDTVIINTLDELTLCRAFANNELSRPIALQSPQLAAYQQRALKAERTLFAYSTEFARLKQYLFTTNQQIAGALTSNRATIEFTNFVYHNNGWTDTVYYVAYIIKHGQQPQMVNLFTEEELLAVLNNSTGSSFAINKNYSNRGEIELIEDDSALFLGLYPLVWQKLEPYLQGIEQVHVSPSGLLSKVSFAALQDTNGIYLGQRYQINYQLSLTDLLFKQNSSPPTSFLIAGGINYTYTPASGQMALSDTINNTGILRSDFTRYGFSQLPGTLAEVNKLHSLIKKTNSKIHLLSNDSASETNLKAALAQNPSVLHVATHGFYIPLADDSELAETENENNYKLHQDPLYRSGIVLAGGNLAWEKGYNPYEKEDGILFAKEVAAMNLSNTRLAVLSACETGLGDLQGTEGVMGLQRALKMAGVQHQIATLWSVPDAETVEFMELFYTSWLEGGLPLQESFSKAQQIMMAKYPQSPYKWGAFVLYN